METFVSSHPAVILTLVSILWIIVVTLLGNWASALKKKLDDHICEANTIMWPQLEKKIDELSKEMREAHEETLERHTEIVRELSFVKAKIPNGDIIRIGRTLNRVVELLENKAK